MIGIGQHLMRGLEKDGFTSEYLMRCSGSNGTLRSDWLRTLQTKHIDQVQQMIPLDALITRTLKNKLHTISSSTLPDSLYHRFAL